MNRRRRCRRRCTHVVLCCLVGFVCNQCRAAPAARSLACSFVRLSVSFVCLIFSLVFFYLIGFFLCFFCFFCFGLFWFVRLVDGLVVSLFLLYITKVD